MKHTILFTFLILQSILLFGQDKEDLYFLESDNTWQKEVIEFPLGFAPEIPFEGYEDLRFAAGWSQKDSPGFWSYVCAWNVSGNIDPTELMLEYYLQLYFDGLMTLGPTSVDDQMMNGTAAIVGKALDGSYRGKIKTFDTRYTQRPMTLNVLIETRFCKKNNRTIILFRFSPQKFEKSIWLKLKEVKVKDGFCDV